MGRRLKFHDRLVSLNLNKACAKSHPHVFFWCKNEPCNLACFHFSNNNPTKLHSLPDQPSRKSRTIGSTESATRILNTDINKKNE